MDTIEITKEGEPDGLAPNDSPSSFLLLKQQHVFHFSSPFNAWYYFPLVAPERDILVVNIPVPGFQL